MTATVASPELLDFINWTLLPQLGQYPHGAITGRGEIVVPATEPGDKPIILRPDDPPKKQSARLLKGRVSGVRLHDPAEQEVGGPGAST